MSRYGAVILGTAAGGAVLGLWQDRMGAIGAVLIGVACLGAVVSLKIGAPQRFLCRKPFHTNPWREIGQGIRRLLSDGELWPAVAGLTCFETLGALVLLNVLLLGKDSMRTDDVHIGLLGALAGIGIAIGALMAGRLSRTTMKTRLIPLGAIGTGAMLVYLSREGDSFAHAGAALLGLGVFSGFFFVPLNSILQRNAGRSEKGHLISTNNFLNMSGVLSASGILWLLHDLFRMTPERILFSGGVAALIVTAWLLSRRRKFRALLPAPAAASPTA